MIVGWDIRELYQVYDLDLVSISPAVLGSNIWVNMRLRKHGFIYRKKWWSLAKPKKFDRKSCFINNREKRNKWPRFHDRDDTISDCFLSTYF